MFGQIRLVQPDLQSVCQVMADLSGFFAGGRYGRCFQQIANLLKQAHLLQRATSATSNLRNKQPAATQQAAALPTPSGKRQPCHFPKFKIFPNFALCGHNATAVLHSTAQRHNTTTPQSRVTAQHTTENHGTHSTQQHQQHTAACYSTRQQHDSQPQAHI